MDTLQSSEAGRELVPLNSRPEVKEGSSLVVTAEAMERAQSEDEMRKSVQEFLDLLSKELNIELTPDITPLYREMNDRGFLIRLESPSVVAKSLKNKTPIRLGGGEDHYANAVVAQNEGVKMAFAEGMAPGPIRLILGFDVRSAIGFDSKGVTVSEVDESEFDLRDTSIRHALCRHVAGNLAPEDIKCFIMRIPKHMLDGKRLTRTETAQDVPFVFRGAKIPEQPVAHETE